MSKEDPEAAESADSSLYPSLLSNLPIEIVSEVFFSACRPRDVDISASERLNPLLLGSICRTWRDIAWSIPRLWSSIYLLLSRKRYNTQTLLVQEWLLRASSCPLTIVIDRDPRDPKVHEWQFHPPITLLSILASFSRQWYYVDLFILDNDSFLETLDQVKNHLPLLKSLSLRPLENSTVPHHAMDMFEDAPRLQNFTLLVLYLNDITLPWTQLRSVRARLTSQECAEILKRCPELESCSFESLFYDEEEEDHGIPLPPSDSNRRNTTSLTIKNTSADEMMPLLSFTYPKLRKLDLSVPPDLGITSTDTLPFQHIISLTSRSTFQLETLSLSSRQFPEHYLCKCLEALPSLIELRLRVDNQDAARISGTSCILHPHLFDAETPIVPNLQVFEYDGYIACSDIFLVSVLTRRWTDSMQMDQENPRVARLKSVAIKSRGGFQLAKDVAESLRQLVQQGLHLSITDGDSHRSLI